MQAGFEIIAACDNDPVAAITYTYNLGAYPMKFVFIEPSDREAMEKALRKEMGFDSKKNEIKKGFITGQGWKHSHPEVPGVGVFFLGDIRKLTGKQILDAVGRKLGEVDCVMGSPPCQGFSTAGKREVMDPRNSLVFEFARLVLEIKPRTMIFENVPGIINMLTPEGLPVLDVFCNMLEKGEYGSAEVLKKSLLVSAGMGAAVKGKKRIKRKDPEETEVDKTDLQLELNL